MSAGYFDSNATDAANDNTLVELASGDNSGNKAIVDAAGKIGVKASDGNGNLLTSDSPGTAGNQRLHVAVPDTLSSTIALNALNVNVQIPVAGLSSVGFQILSGTFIGTIVPEISMDGGTTWFVTNFYDFTTTSVSSSETFSSANPTKMFTVITLGGTSHARVRVSAFTSGTANAMMRASQGVSVSVSPNGAAGGAAAYGTVTNAYPTLPGNTATLILAANSSRKYAYISNNSGSQLNLQFGSSTGIGANAGLVIPARSFYEIKGDNLFTGNIYGFAAGGITISVTEGTP